MPPKYDSKCSPKFWKLFDDLPERIKAEAKLAYKEFSKDPLSSGLNFEEMTQRKGVYTVRVNRQYRALAKLQNGNVLYWIWIGTHGDFDQLFKRNRSL